MSTPDEIQVSVWVSLKAGSVLACKPSSIGPWYLPGGLVELGESPDEAVSREVREEIGIELDLTSLRHAGVVRGPAHGRPNVEAVMWVFVGSGEGTPTPRPPEIEDLQWLALDQIHTMAPLAADAVRLVIGR